METIRWGIVGAGNIAHRFASSLSHVEGSELAAISGRSRERLACFADECALSDSVARYADDDDADARRGERLPGEATAVAGSGHERLIADPTVDAVYLALPHGMHARWAIAALRAGKAVLCEKPATVSSAEAERIAEASRETGVLFMEAMKCRFTPAHDELMRVLGSGELGPIRSLDLVHRLDYGDIRGGYLLDPVQGGALFDLGCYDLSWVEELLSGEFEALRGRASWRHAMPSGSGWVDMEETSDFTLGGIPVHLDLSGESSKFACQLIIRCESGVVEMPLLHRPVSFAVTFEAGAPHIFDCPYVVDDFYGQIEHFCGLMRAGRTESDVMPLAATVRLARLTEQVRATFGDAPAL